jgi:hypothetical protein
VPVRNNGHALSHSAYAVEHAPSGPLALVAGRAQVVPLHWYHSSFDADCTQVRAGTPRPSVADWHHSNVVVQPLAVLRACHAPATHA